MDNESLLGFGQGGPKVVLQQADPAFPNGVVVSYPFHFGAPAGKLERGYSFDGDVQGWTADSGTLTQTGGKLQLAGGSNSTALEPSGVINVADGELYADMLTTVAATSGGVVFRATDFSNYYAFVWAASNVGNVTVTLYKKVAGSYTSLASLATTVGSLVTTMRVRLLVRFVGSNIWFYANDVLQFAWQDSTYTTGRIGLFANGATTQYDTVRVYSLPSGWVAPI